MTVTAANTGSTWPKCSSRIAKAPSTSSARCNSPTAGERRLPANKNSANPGRTIWSVLLLSDLCQGDQCRRVGSAWPACYGCDQGVIAKVQAWLGHANISTTRIYDSMIAVSRDRRTNPLSKCATRRLSTVKTGIARLATPLFPYPTPCSTASTCSTPSTLSTMSTE